MIDFIFSPFLSYQSSMIVEIYISMNIIDFGLL